VLIKVLISEGPKRKKQLRRIKNVGNIGEAAMRRTYAADNRNQKSWLFI
jgi:hypothetical protein